MKKLLIVCGLVLLGMQNVSAQKVDDFGIFEHVGANLGVGTEGISIGVAAPVTNYLEVGLGVNFMPGFKANGDVDINVKSTDNPGLKAVLKNYDLRTINIEGNMARTTLDFKVSAYPFGVKNDFFVVAGFSFAGKDIVSIEGNNSEIGRLYAEHPEYRDEIKRIITANVDQYDITIDDKGHAEGDVRVNAFRPYLGLGYGRLVPKGRVGFRVEAGVQFMGKMKVYQNDTEVNITELKKGNDDLSKIIDKWKVYPVLKFMLTTRIL